MLRGQVAVFLSCSEKFKETLARPVHDALAGQGLRGIILGEEPPLPGGSTAEAGAYLDASSAFVALCAADYELSDGTRYPRASVIDEIQQALSRPHLRDRTQVLKGPGVLLPSDITPTYDSLDVAKPAVAAEVIIKQLQQWGIAGPGESPAAPPHHVGAWQADDVDALLAGAPPADQDEACRRVYPLLRDRSEDRRRWIARELCRETMESARDARALAASALLQAVSGLDAALVPDEIIEALATHPRYQARACAAQLLRDRAAVAPLDVPVEVLGRLVLPGAEDWLVWAPAMAAVQELVLHRRDAYVVLESLGASADARDRFAVAAALLAIAQVRPAAVARGLATRLADDADGLVAAKAAEVMSATEQVTERDHAACYGRFWGAGGAGE
jgi:GNAT superfamily N-acetyltransferase